MVNRIKHIGDTLARSLLALATLLVVLSARADNTLRGAPLLDRYSTETVGAPPRFFSATHDNDGRLYVANQKGLLRYDGDRWELLTLPGKAPATAVGRSRDGRIYVGGFDLFGRISNDIEGQMQFIDLRPRRGNDERAEAVANVWQIIDDGPLVHIRTESALYTLNSEDRIVRTVALPDTARLFFATPFGLLGRINGRGLVRVEADGTLSDFPDGKLFADKGMIDIVETSGRVVIVAERSFYQLHKDGISALGNAKRTAYGDDRANAALALSDGSIVVGTLHGELLRLDPGLTIRERVPINDGSIEALHVDAERGVWALGEGELVRVRLPAQWTKFSAVHHVTGTIYDTEWHDGALWLAGSAGLQRMAPDASRAPRAEHLPWFDYEGYALQSTSGGLLVGYRSGLLVVEHGLRWRSILSDGEAVQWLLPLPRHQDRMFAVGERHVFMLALQQGRWRILHSEPLGGISPTSVIGGPGEGELWLSDSRDVPQRWQFDLASGAVITRVAFGSDAGLPQVEGHAANLFKLDNRIHAAVDEQAFVFDGGRFVPDRGAPATLVEHPDDLIVVDSPAGTFALTWNEILRRAPGSQRWDRLYFGAGLDRGYVGMRLGSDGIVRLITWTGVLQFDPSQTPPPEPTLTASFSSIGARSPAGVFTPLPRQSGSSPAIVPAGNSLEMRFGLITMEPGALFRYRLHGYTLGWSTWRADRVLTLRAPAGGDYAIEVQARTQSGREASPLYYRFTVQPAWTEIAWVRAALVAVLMLALAALIHWVAWWRTQRLQLATHRLESRIAERTAELEVANRKLAELATEDSLTGIANRRALDNGLVREWHRCLDQRRPIAALMIDVDHFKRYNDEHGHLEGDVVLKRIADVLTRLHNPNRELLARFGGEEFALLLPGLHVEEAHNRALELCKMLAAADLKLTVSIGVAAQVPSPLDDPHVLLRRADAALYRAKRNGRNRVEIAND